VEYQENGNTQNAANHAEVVSNINTESVLNQSSHLLDAIWMIAIKDLTQYHVTHESAVRDKFCKNTFTVSLSRTLWAF